MGLNDLMGAVAIASGNAGKLVESVGTGENKKIVNSIHVINLIAKVYARCAVKFVDADMSKHQEIIEELMRSGEALKCVAKRGVVTDADAVSVLEALKWTSAVMLSNGEVKPRIKLALIEPNEDKGAKDSSNIDLTVKDMTSCNGFVLETFEGQEYDEVYKIMQAGPKSVKVLATSIGLYDVLLEQ